MSKKIKIKGLSVIIAIIILLQLCVPNVFAEDINAILLSTIADDLIEIDESVNDDGSVVTTYNNLDVFILEINNSLPSITDLEIAHFILEYTNQDSDAIPEEEALKFLDFDNITTSSQYIEVQDSINQQTNQAYQRFNLADIGIQNFAIAQEISPNDVWTSSNGAMQITTTYSYKKTVGREKYYSAIATAKWINFPNVCLQDCFAIGTNATFDSNFLEAAYVSQVFSCTCGEDFSLYRTVNKTSPVDDDLELTYETGFPAIHFDPIAPRCEYCLASNVRDKSFTVYLTYGFIADESVTIQAGYAHKTFGLGNINIGIDLDGLLSFSGTLTTITKYIARPVTVNYNG